MGVSCRPLAVGFKKPVCSNFLGIVSRRVETTGVKRASGGDYTDCAGKVTCEAAVLAFLIDGPIEQFDAVK